MAIAKNTAPAKAEVKKLTPTKTAEAKAPAKAPAKVAPKADAKKPAPAKVAKPAPAKTEAKEVEKEAVTQIGRKDIAAIIRDKVMAAGLAISPKVAEVAAVAYEEAIQESLAKGDTKISLPGFGVFSVAFREAREAINPQDPTGAKIQVPATNVPKFKPGSKLKAAVNGGAAEEGTEGEAAAE